MKRLRLRKNVRLNTVPLPSPTRTRDALGRLEQAVFVYPSIRVTYDVAWVGTTNTLDTYTQTTVSLP